VTGSVVAILAVGLAVVTAVMVATAISSRVAGRVSVVDVAWGLGFIAVALAGALLGGGDETRGGCSRCW